MTAASFWTTRLGAKLWYFRVWCRYPLPTARHRIMRRTFSEYVEQWDL